MISTTATAFTAVNRHIDAATARAAFVYEPRRRLQAARDHAHLYLEGWRGRAAMAGHALRRRLVLLALDAHFVLCR